jgi:uncharacterized protein YjbI with pentapeptide repeats
MWLDVDASSSEFHLRTVAAISLRGMVFDHQNLANAEFGAAELHGTSFRGSILSGADLSGTKGLTPEQLAGANLSAAKLPETLDFPACDVAVQIASRAEKVLYLLLATCASIIFFLATIDPRQLYIGTSTVVIPTLQLPVSLKAFFSIAPIVLIALYTSLCFTVRKLAITLSDLPARFPNGRTLDEYFVAFTPNVAVLACDLWHHLRPQREEIRRERNWVVFLVWWATPATLLAVWAIYLETHDTMLISWHVICFIIIAFLGNSSYSEVQKILRVNQHRNSGRSRYVRISHLLWPTFTGTWYRVGRPGLRTRRTGFLGRVSKNSASFAIAVGIALGAVSLVAVDAAIGEVSIPLLSCKPGNCLAMANASLAHASLPKFYSPGRNLRRANLHSADLRFADLEQANLDGANLSSATLLHANLSSASIRRAALRNANLDSAELRGANLDGADLSGASLQGAGLEGVDLTHARLTGARLSNAVVCGASFDSLSFSYEQLRDMHGLRFALGQVQRKDRALLETDDSPAAYLHGDSRDTFERWERAWQQVFVPVTLHRGMRVYRDLVLQGLYEIDVNMDESTQLLKDDLVESLLGVPPRRQPWIVVPQDIVATYGRFRERIRMEAIRHCVDVRQPYARGTSAR